MRLASSVWDKRLRLLNFLAGNQVYEAQRVTFIFERNGQTTTPVCLRFVKRPPDLVLPP